MTPSELKTFRSEQGMVAREMAKVFGVHPRSYQKWEGGVNKIPLTVDLVVDAIRRTSWRPATWIYKNGTEDQSNQAV